MKIPFQYGQPFRPIDSLILPSAIQGQRKDSKHVDTLRSQQALKNIKVTKLSKKKIKNLLAYCLLELKVPAAINMVRNLRTGTRIESVQMPTIFIRLV